MNWDAFWTVIIGWLFIGWLAAAILLIGHFTTGRQFVVIMAALLVLGTASWAGLTKAKT